MGVVIPLNEAQVSFVYSCTGSTRQIHTTFGVRPDNSAVSPETIALDLEGHWIASTMGVAAQFSNQFVWVKTIVQKMTTSGIASAEETSGLAGTGSWGPPPLNAAIVVQKFTGLGGRKNRGRMFLPVAWCNETAISAAGVMGTAETSAIQTDMTAFATGLSAGDYPMVIFHSDGSPSTLVQSLTVQQLLGTQRRRMR